MLPMKRAGVQSLDGELRFHTTHGAAKNQNMIILITIEGLVFPRAQGALKRDKV